MKKSIYAVSDIHGHCAELKKALDEAGFRINDESCLLIVCGDYFDRGVENREVFDFLCSVSNKILIRGNHEDMLEQLL
jgi:serine/threonine protein phosphatase 1